MTYFSTTDRHQIKNCLYDAYIESDNQQISVELHLI